MTSSAKRNTMVGWLVLVAMIFVVFCVVASIGAAIDSPRTCTTTDTVVGLYGTSTTVCK